MTPYSTSSYVNDLVEAGYVGGYRATPRNIVTGKTLGQEFQRTYRGRLHQMVPILEQRQAWQPPPPPPEDNSYVARLYRQEHGLPQMSQGVYPQAPVSAQSIHYGNTGSQNSTQQIFDHDFAQQNNLPQAPENIPQLERNLPQASSPINDFTMPSQFGNNKKAGKGA